MSNSIRSHAPLFLLLGALSFSLSSIPGYGGTGSTSLSSEIANTCAQLTQQIDGGAESGTCEIRPRSGEFADLMARIEVKQGEIRHRDADDNVVTTKGWKYTMHILCKDPSKCTDDVESTSIQAQPLASFRDVTAETNKAFRAEAIVIARRIKEAAKLKKDIEDCVVKEDDPSKKIAEGAPRLSCQIEHMGDMAEDDAAKYYEDKIQPELTKLTASDKLSDQRDAFKILTQLQKSDSGGAFVTESVKDLLSFGQAKATADNMRVQILAMAPGQAREQAILQMKGLEAQWQASFRSHEVEVSRMNWPDSSTIGFADALVANLQDYSARLTQNFDLITQNHSLMVNGANGATPNPSADPRTNSRGGTVVTSPAQLAPAAGAAVNNGQPQVLNRAAGTIPAAGTIAAPNSTFQQQSVKSATGIPQSGTTVRIR